jgi:hypothetical protein
MSRADELLVLAGLAGGMALTLMLGVKLISPTRYAQGLGGGLAGLALAKLALVLGGADHG